MRHDLVVIVRCPQRAAPATDMQRMRAWLRFMRWLYQTGRLTGWPPESTEV